MHTKYSNLYKEIKRKSKAVQIGNFSLENSFDCVLRAAFAKNIEFNLLVNKKELAKYGFFLSSSLRSICEDLIALKFIRTTFKSNKGEFLSRLGFKRTLEAIKIQEQFFKNHKPEQPVLSINNLTQKEKENLVTLRRILKENGLNQERELPSVAHMSTDSKLIRLYDYLYYSTSKSVHFEPQLLLKLGWNNSPSSMEFKYSTENFYKYYQHFNSYYASYLFILFYDSFKKDLGLDLKIKDEINKLKTFLADEIRVPEFVTFEEMNVKPPSIVLRLLLHAVKNTK